MNDIWAAFHNKKFTRADMREFYQLIGYSTSGYGEIFHATKKDRESVAKADIIADSLYKAKNK